MADRARLGHEVSWNTCGRSSPCGPTQVGTPATYMLREHIASGEEGRRRSTAVSVATRNPRATSLEGRHQVYAKLPGAGKLAHNLHKITTYIYRITKTLKSTGIEYR